MGNRSKQILIGAMAAVCATVLFTAVFHFGWFQMMRGGLPAKEAALRYPYQNLSSREQALYGTLYRGIEAHEEQIKLPGIYDRETYERVYLLLAEQEPQFFYLDSLYETADAMSDVNIFYSVEADQISVMTSQMNLAADRILQQAEGASNEMQRLVQIHDGIAALCEYSDGAFQSEAYGCLVNGEAKCEGYAKALLYVARRAGINIMNVTGTIRSGENHVWNIAEIDGQYYNIDLTWDDDSQYRGNVTHVCFALPDAMFRDHRADLTAYQPPACTDDTHSYYQMNGLIVKQAGELPQLVQTWPWNPSLMEFQLQDSDVYREVSELIASSEDVRNAVKQVSGAASYRAMMDETRNAMVILPS